MVQQKSIMVLQGVLATLFIYSGILKLLDLTGFAQSMYSYKILSKEIIPFFAVYVPVFEVCLGISFLFRSFLKPVIACCIVLMIVFQSALSSLIYRGIKIDCGCFGKFATTPEAALLRNFVILAILGLLLFLLYRSVKLQNRKSESPSDL